MTQSDEPRIKIEGTGNVIGDYNTVIVYPGDRPVSAADVLGACRGQVQSMVTEARHKYDPALYVHRAIEQELNGFFDTPLTEGAPNCYLIVAPAGSGKTNLLCHLAGERAPLGELNKYAQRGGGVGSLNAMHPYFARRSLTASRAMTLAALHVAESGGDVDYAAFAENHRFQIPTGAHWRGVRAVTTNVGQALQNAMRAIEQANQR